jgi:transposase, IS30 family
MPFPEHGAQFPSGLRAEAEKGGDTFRVVEAEPEPSENAEVVGDQPDAPKPERVEQRSHMVTLVERHSNYLLVLPLLDATTRTVVAALMAAFQQLPPTMRRSLTRDRGVEMTRHADFTAATGIPVYFCDAYCPWQRGSNENSNGLLRQYFPKKTDLSQHDADHIQAVVNELNTRPRRTLGWQTPHEVFWAATVAMIA